MASTSADTNLPDQYLAKRPFEKLRLAMVPRSAAADAAHLALFQLQDITEPETQVLGIAVLFAAVAARLHVDPSELHGMGMAVLKERADGDVVTSNSLQVLRDFAAIRYLGEQVTIY